jgi:hypothetical protein
LILVNFPFMKRGENKNLNVLNKNEGGGKAFKP